LAAHTGINYCDRGVEPHPILKLAIKEAEETVTQACVSAPDSSLVDKALKETRVHDETGMWVLVIKRGITAAAVRIPRLPLAWRRIASGYAEALKMPLLPLKHEC